MSGVKIQQSKKELGYIKIFVGNCIDRSCLEEMAQSKKKFYFITLLHFCISV